jgi:hypothetical protein
MSHELFLEIVAQAEQLTPAEQQRLARYADWLANRPAPINRVGHRLKDILKYQDVTFSELRNSTKEAVIKESIPLCAQTALTLASPLRRPIAV